MSAEIDLHEFTTQLQSMTDQRVMDTVRAKPESDGGHVVERTATSVWLYDWSDEAHRYLPDEDIPEDSQGLSPLC